MVLNTLLRSVWPSQCVSCSHSIAFDGFCHACTGSIVPGRDVSCTQCGDIFLDLPYSASNYRCGSCLSEGQPYMRGRSAFAYGAAMRDAIIAWKNRSRPEIGKVLGAMMFRELEKDWLGELSPSTEVVPIPTSFRRAFSRGFNPAGQLARLLATKRGLRCTTSYLALRQSLPRAHGLSKRQRKHRNRSRFVAQPTVRGKNILLVDDVRATGQTLREASKVLRRQGAVRIDVAVLAAVPNEH